jgi:hypothetical protein
MLFIKECPSRISDRDSGFYVFITVNSVVKTCFLGDLETRMIELNWTPPPGGVRSGDWVGLFKRDASGFRINGSTCYLRIFNQTFTQPDNVHFC